jgi:hypothetical protein
MRRTISLTVAAGLLGLGSASAHADHDRHLRYVVGGALIGATVGGLVYASGRDARHHAPARGTVVYHHAPAPVPSTVVYHHAPPPRAGVVYYAPAPAVGGFVGPGHRQGQRARTGPPPAGETHRMR